MIRVSILRKLFFHPILNIMPITVITHNGKMPHEGGQRIAYQSDDGFLVSIGGYVPLDIAIANWRAAQVVPVFRAPAATPDRQAEYNLMPSRMQNANYCAGCDSYLSFSTREEFNVGPGVTRTVYKCHVCGKRHQS